MNNIHLDDMNLTTAKANLLAGMNDGSALVDSRRSFGHLSRGLSATCLAIRMRRH